MTIAPKDNEIPNFSPLDAALFCYHPKIAIALINAGAQIKQEHTLLFWKWFCAAPLHASSREASESYKQLKKSFQDPIWERVCNFFLRCYGISVTRSSVNQTPTKDEPVSDSRIVMRINSEINTTDKTSHERAEELTNRPLKLEGVKSLLFFKRRNNTSDEQRAAYCEQDLQIRSPR